MQRCNSPTVMGYQSVCEARLSLTRWLIVAGHTFAFSALTHTNVHQLSHRRIHYSFASLQLLEMTAPNEWVYPCVCDLPLFHYITCHFHFSSAAYRNFAISTTRDAAAAEFYGSVALMDNKTDTEPLNP